MSGSERVLVGLSGGVDSSVAAALLVEAGHEVVGVTLHLAGSASRCCSLDDADDARRVAERLGIRFYVANLKQRFEREIMQPFADDYLAGRTPIPCVACNRRFKFEHLLARARALGFEAIATGHFARVESDPSTGQPRLLRGVDAEKDQSYFLWGLGPETLRRVRFPLGALTKSEVRERARALGLATAEKPESQEICFVPDGDYARVVERLRPEALPGEGEIVDASGSVLGRHAGVHRFTVGQRRGLGLGEAGRRLYVQRLDAARNRVVVGERAGLACAGAELEQVSFVAGEAPRAALEVEARVRYRHAGAAATLEPLAAGRARLRFAEPVEAVSPGQSAVFYAGEQVLGGGTIAAAIAA